MAQKYSIGITLGKVAKSFAIAACVLIVSAFLQGLENFKPDNATQAIIWNIVGAGLIGLVTGLKNWLKNKDLQSPNS